MLMILLVWILSKEAEQSGYTAEDVQVSLNHCRDTNPVQWLKENWENMIETVMTLASNVGHEAAENTIGTLSQPEARTALRKHKGNIWAAVTECVEQRQSKVGRALLYVEVKVTADVTFILYEPLTQIMTTAFAPLVRRALQQGQLHQGGRCHRLDRPPGKHGGRLSRA